MSEERTSLSGPPLEPAFPDDPNPNPNPIPDRPDKPPAPLNDPKDYPGTDASGRQSNNRSQTSNAEMVTACSCQRAESTGRWDLNYRHCHRI